MTRKEQLTFCNRCFNRKFDQDQGMICTLSNKPADFEISCKDYRLDPSVQSGSQSEITEHSPKVYNSDSEKELIVYILLNSWGR